MNADHKQSIFLVNWELIAEACCENCTLRLWNIIFCSSNPKRKKTPRKQTDFQFSCLDARFPPGSFVELVVSDSKDFLSG